MPAPVISVENLSKRYLIGHRAERRGYHSDTAMREMIGRELRNAARKAGDILHRRQVVQGDAVEEFWALNDVSFEVQQGEVVGIIGRNGAGKSTLLKILSRITEPTSGRVTLRGRIASLIEVGTGFHPELSGRENIYLNGAILGMSRAEIRKKFDEIVAFAEVETFLDTPVKRYSSGMYVRLAFAVAAHLEPEILIVDEVLAVGDAEFQRKCLGKMDDVSRREGRTVLVVSHNMGVITGLCAKALWLDRGAIHEQGAPQAVVGRYLARSAQNQDRVIRLDHSQRDPLIQDDRLRFTAVEWLSPLPPQHGDPVKLRLHFEARAAVAGISTEIGFNSIEGARVLTYHMGLRDGPHYDLARPDKYAVDLAIDVLHLGPDLYNLDIVCRSGDLHVLDSVPGCAQLEVMAGPTTPAAIAQRHPGVRLEGNWSWARAEQPSEPEIVLEAREGGSRGAKGLSGVARQKLSDRHNPPPGFGDVLFGDVGDPAAMQPGGDGPTGVQGTAGAAPLFIGGAGCSGTTVGPFLGGGAILVLGLGRSGTTWLAKIFDSHPDVLYRNEPDIALRDDRLPLFCPLPEVEAHLQQAREYLQRLTEIRTWKSAGPLPVFSKGYRSAPARLLRAGLIAGVALADRTDRWAARVPLGDFITRGHDRTLRIVIKSVTASGRARLFAEAWPDSRIVVIVRHPCGQIASVVRGNALGKLPSFGLESDLARSPEARRLGLRVEEGVVWPKIEQLAWVWALANQKMTDELRGMDRVRIVKYEDLAADPIGVARNLFEFVDLSWNLQTERFIESSTRSDRRGYYSIRQNPQTALSKWREELSVEDQQRILAITQRVEIGRAFT